MVDVYSQLLLDISVLLKHWIQLSVVSLEPAGADNATFDITFSPERSDSPASL